MLARWHIPCISLCTSVGMIMYIRWDEAVDLHAPMDRAF